MIIGRARSGDSEDRAGGSRSAGRRDGDAGLRLPPIGEFDIRRKTRLAVGAAERKIVSEAAAPGGRIPEPGQVADGVAVLITDAQLLSQGAAASIVGRHADRHETVAAAMRD